MRSPDFDSQTDRYWYRRYCAAAESVHPGAHVVCVGGRVAVVLDAGGSGWTSPWPEARRRFIAGGEV